MGVPVAFLVDADAFPPIFLVIQLECCPVSSEHEGFWSGAWETPQFAPAIFFEKGDVFKFELNCLLRLVAPPLYSVFPDP